MKIATFGAPRRLRGWRGLLAAIGTIALLATACGGGSGTTDPQTTATEQGSVDPQTTATEQGSADPAARPETRGPNGEEATPSSELELTDAEQAQIREGAHSVALVWAAESPFIEAVSDGINDVFDSLNIEIVARTDAGFDAATQADDVETVLARQPDAIISLIVDQVSAANAFQPAVDAGVQLVFLSNVPEGFQHGEEFAGVATDDLAGMGIAAAELMGDAIGGEGKVGFIFHDAEFFVTNQRDQAFKEWLTNRYPGVEIVAEQGMAEVESAEQIASSMLTRDPEIAGIYAPWSAGPGEGVLSALRAAGRDDVALVSMDLSTPMAVDLAEGGNVAGLAVDEAYELGRALALEVAYSLVDKPTPEFVIVPAIKVTQDNLLDAYERSLNTDAPQEVADAIGN